MPGPISSLTARFQRVLGLEKKASIASPDAMLFDLFGARPSSAGVVVTARRAMECAPVHCAVQAISEAMGQLPVQVMQGESERDTTHPASPLLDIAANDWTPAAKF